MHNITISRINSSDPMYQQVWNLREEILRKPLGLSLKNEDLSCDKINTIFIALYANKVIGCVFMQPLNKSEIQLRAMAVYNEWQGKGIGRLLVQAAEEWAWNEGYDKIILHARKVAFGFYKSLSYHLSGNEFTEVGIPHCMMEKPRPGTDSPD
ncbi:MAG: GNAT family N-acetyltransferase [Chitinophagales bacterium]